MKYIIKILIISSIVAAALLLQSCSEYSGSGYSSVGYSNYPYYGPGWGHYPHHCCWDDDGNWQRPGKPDNGDRIPSRPGVPGKPMQPSKPGQPGIPTKPGVGGPSIQPVQRPATRPSAPARMGRPAPRTRMRAPRMRRR